MKVSDRTYFTLKRLHSLSGVVPIGLFLLEHLYTNARSLQGPAAFDAAVADLARLAFAVSRALSALGVGALLGFPGFRAGFLQKPHAAGHCSVVLERVPR